MARRTPKKAGKSKAKALKRTAKGRGAKPAAVVRAKRKPARGKPARKPARVSSKPTSRKTTGPRKRPARRPDLQVGRDSSKAAKTAKAVKTRKTSKAIKPPPRRAAAPRKAAAPASAPAAAKQQRIRPLLVRTPPARLDRVRRTLDDIVPTPPSSLDLNRDASAARSGRAEIAESKHDHQTMSPSITGGDVDISVEGAYFSGDEAPGGDNPTPDQDIVDDIGRALGVQYQDNEELQSGDKVAERDKHRWELDPASAEDYRDRK